MVALAYEVVWVRALDLVVGNSLWAAMAVVAAYMGGMAAGAALAALATGPALGMLQRVAARFGPEPLTGWGLPLLARFVLTWAFLALPTVAMGATLPLLVARIGLGTALAWRVGRLYAANTFGAVAGVVLAGFVTLPEVGERGTLASFTSLGLLVALLVWFAEGRVPAATMFAATEAPTRRHAWLLFPVFFGFVALACELVWTRVLLLHLGSRVYAFALILVVYLAGVAGGSALTRWLTARPRRALAVCQILLSVFLGLQILLVANFSDVLGWIAVHAHLGGFGGLQIRLALAVGVLLLPPTLAFGASSPLSVAAANTAGAIAGTVLGPLVLVPLVGSRGLILALGAVSVLAGVALGSSRFVRAFWEVFPSTCIWYDPVVLNELTVVAGSLQPGPVGLRWQALGDPALAATLSEAGVRGVGSLGAMLLLGPQEVASLVSDVPSHVDNLPEVE
jgi:spermidine synthase